MSETPAADTGIDVPADRYIAVMTRQRNEALDRAAQMEAVAEALAEQVQELRAENQRLGDEFAEGAAARR